MDTTEAAGIETQEELNALADEDEVNVAEAPYGGEFVAVSEEPWELPNFTLREARDIGKIAADLLTSGEWAKVEESILAVAGRAGDAGLL